MSKLKGFFKSVLGAWKKIRFLSWKELVHRCLVVMAAIVVLAALIVALDFLFQLGLTGLSAIAVTSSDGVKVVRVALSVLFLISAVCLIVLQVLKKSDDSGFGFLSGNQNYFSKSNKKTSAQWMSVTIKVVATVCAVTSLVIFILS